MTSRLRLALHVSPSILVRRGFGVLTDLWRARSKRAADFRNPTYAADTPAGPLTPFLSQLDVAAFRTRCQFAIPLANLHRKGMFDLLGSGWIAPSHGMTCAGCEGYAYPATAPVSADRNGLWLQSRINPANLTSAQAFWQLTDTDYTPIDWHLDFKSGFRWREDAWHGDIVYGHTLGADIKVPWELARMQHLVLFAAAYAANGDESFARAARDQVLDFIAQNPPRFGVNWCCTMDVAIRAANWAMAWSLFRALEYSFDEEFEEILKQSLFDHGRHIVSHLEWYPEGRGNHYLANVSGLAFVAAVLPSTPETDAWLAFASQEVQSEIEHQFYSDGGNFEASVAYHRLSLEMAVFVLALLVGLSESCQQRLNNVRLGAHYTRPRRPLLIPPTPLDKKVFVRMKRATRFLRDLTKPDGKMAQIGDNDSGRFFKLHPVYEKTTASEARVRYANLANWRELPDDSIYWDESVLDGRATVAAAAVLLEDPKLTFWAGESWLDSLVIAALKKGAKVPFSATDSPSPVRIQIGGCPDANTPVAIVEIVVPGGTLREGLTAIAYPDFGVYIFRSERLFLCVRCGPIGQNGRGGHAHNDQLAIELMVDGEDWIADPGSYLYTADRRWRNAYRSVAAHAAPCIGTREPGRLDLGDFWLSDEARARCFFFTDNCFIGKHWGFGSAVWRKVEILEDRIVLQDSGAGITPGKTLLNGRDAVRSHFRLAVSFSPGYGKKIHEIG